MMKKRNYLKKIKGFYSEDILIHDIAGWAGSLSDTEFAGYQTKLTSDFIGFEIQRISISIKDPDMESNPRQKSSQHLQGIGNKNQKWQLDGPGEPELDRGETQKTLFVEEYCIPNMQGRYFILEYFAEKPHSDDQDCIENALQYISVPFYFAWLMRLGHIDCATLLEWYRLLVGVTPARLCLLREIVNTGRYQTSVVAKRLALSDRVVRNYVSEALNSISYLLPDLEMKTSNSSQCIDLVRYYWFLRYVGTGKKKL